MNSKDGYLRLYLFVFILIIIVDLPQNGCLAMTADEKRKLRDDVLEMFHHGYDNYMTLAYPADELMPLSCKGRYRGTQPSRGDVDDALGNFSLTLVDTLDTLVVLGELEEFERAVVRVVNDVSFDRDIVVSVFETNIRMMGGLLGGHVMALYLKKKELGMFWYEDELLEKAKELGYRMLPAFNTTTGIPYPRVNLRHGVKPHISRTGHERDTCTACAGSMILEFAALSRLSGDPIFEEKAHNAIEALWKARHRTSDLMGTVINIHNGDWVRRDSGVGAGIDSYYEYLMKGYILLGDEVYLDRFNKHYAAIMKYMSQGPMLVDVLMHKPLSNSRHYMDALLAFWPGLQVLKGDIKPAIEMHEMLYQVTKRHKFLPEAFTTDFRVYWAQHPLRPEFVESTYFIYKATGDPYYLDVGKSVLENLNEHARVKCGFAAIKDVTTGAHEDQMDSFVLAETFKYLYLLFSEPSDRVIDVDDFVFTTEAHLLPLTLSMYKPEVNSSRDPTKFDYDQEDEDFERSCPNTNYLFRGNLNFAHNLRHPMKNFVDNLCPKPRDSGGKKGQRLMAASFVAGNQKHVDQLRQMGIRIITMRDGRVQLLHTASEASSPDDAEDGMLFMQEMIELSKSQPDVQQEPRVIQLLSSPYFGNLVLSAGPAQFGQDLKLGGITGEVIKSDPIKCCSRPENVEEMKGKIVLVERGDCMFIDKGRVLEETGVIGAIVMDNNHASSSEHTPLFAMSGDGKNDVQLPMVFLFYKQAEQLLEAMSKNPRLQVYLSHQGLSSESVMKTLLSGHNQKARDARAQGLTHIDPNAQSAADTARTAQMPVSVDDLDVSQSSASGVLKNDEMQAIIKEYMRKVQIMKMRKQQNSAQLTGTDSDVAADAAMERDVKQDLQSKTTTEEFPEAMDDLVKMVVGGVQNNVDENVRIYNLGKMAEATFGKQNGKLSTERHVQDMLEALKVISAEISNLPGSTVKNEKDGEQKCAADEDEDDFGEDTIDDELSMDPITQSINQKLDIYIQSELGKVLEETERLVKTSEPVTPTVATGDNQQGVLHAETDKLRQHYATAEDLMEFVDDSLVTMEDWDDREDDMVLIDDHNVISSSDESTEDTALRSDYDRTVDSAIDSTGPNGKDKLPSDTAQPDTRQFENIEKLHQTDQHNLKSSKLGGSLHNAPKDSKTFIRSHPVVNKQAHEKQNQDHLQTSSRKNQSVKERTKEEL